MLYLLLNEIENLRFLRNKNILRMPVLPSGGHVSEDRLNSSATSQKKFSIVMLPLVTSPWGIPASQ